jgi:hypothetical protein
MKARQALLFLKKKKQKSFRSLRSPGGPTSPGPKEQKFFAALFLKKARLPSLALH